MSSKRSSRNSLHSSQTDRHQGNRAEAAVPGGEPFASRRNPTWRFPLSLLPILLLVAVAITVYANAWPNVLVHDDKFYSGSYRFSEWSNILRYFSENAWASSGVTQPLYRPLLLVSITLDARLHGDWVAGYHLTNIALHAITTLVVYGFLLQLLRCTNATSRWSVLAALLSALLFAVHPVHAEVVNSVFNRSEMLAAIGVLAGLTWLLRWRDSSPIVGWTGVSFAYLFTLLCRETAIVLPALAAFLVWFLVPGNSIAKLRKTLPVLWLIVPLSVYILLRASALSPTEQVLEQTAHVAPSPATSFDPLKATPKESRRERSSAPTNAVQDMLENFKVPGKERLMGVTGLWYRSLQIMVWPRNLSVDHGPITQFDQTAGLILMTLIALAAVALARRGRLGLALGLLFFCIAMLPASRITGDIHNPHLAERYLYLPSVGLAIALAFGIRALASRFNAVLAAAIILAAAVVLTPLTWARSAAWSSEVRLFETDYAAGNRGGELLTWLTAAHVRAKNDPRVAEICGENPTAQEKFGKLSMHCAIAYGRLGQEQKAEQAYLRATRSKAVAAMAHANLARFYLARGRRNSAIEHFALAAEAESLPANRAWRKGNMLVSLYPRDRNKLLEAKAHFEEALRLQPASGRARQSLRQVDWVLSKR